MAITVDGELPPGVTSKDSSWRSSPKIGTGGGRATSWNTGASHPRSFRWTRMTMCNMSIEAGARAGMIAPDEIT